MKKPTAWNDGDSSRKDRIQTLPAHSETSQNTRRIIASGPGFHFSPLSSSLEKTILAVSLLLSQHYPLDSGPKPNSKLLESLKLRFHEYLFWFCFFLSKSTLAMDCQASSSLWNSLDLKEFFLINFLMISGLVDLLKMLLGESKWSKLREFKVLLQLCHL